MNHNRSRLGCRLAAMLGVILCLGEVRNVLPAAHGQTPSLQEIKARHVFQAPMGGITALAISSDGSALAVAAGDKTVTVWDTVQGKELATLRGYAAPVTALAFSADGTTLATLSKDKIVRVWKWRAGKDPMMYRDMQAEAGLLTICVDGKILHAYATSGMEGKTRSWTEFHVREVGSAKQRSLGKYYSDLTIPGISPMFGALGFLADGQTLAIRSNGPGGDLFAMFVDTTTGKERGKHLGLGNLGDMPRLGFSRDGKTVAIGTDRSFQTQDLATGKVLSSGKGIAGLALIAPDLRTLVSVDPKGAVVKVWDTAAGQLPKGEPAARAADVKDYLAKDGKLKEKLTLAIREGGGGISGAYTGTVWVIEPSGAWTRETIAGLAGDEGTKKLVANGQLTGKQLLALAHHFAAQDFKALPARVTSRGPGNGSGPGSLHVAIDFGTKRTDLSTRLGGSLADSAPQADDPRASEWSRFVALTLVLQDLLKGGKAEPKKAK